MLEEEMNEHLGYEKYKHSDTPNSRNGYKSKEIMSNAGSITIDVPQNRYSASKPKVVKKGHKGINAVKRKIIAVRPVVTQGAVPSHNGSHEEMTPSDTQLGQNVWRAVDNVRGEATGLAITQFKKTSRRQTEKLTLSGLHPLVETDGVYRKDAVTSKSTATAAAVLDNLQKELHRLILLISYINCVLHPRMPCFLPHMYGNTP